MNHAGQTLPGSDVDLLTLGFTVPLLCLFAQKFNCMIDLFTVKVMYHDLSLTATMTRTETMAVPTTATTQITTVVPVPSVGLQSAFSLSGKRDACTVYSEND